MNANAKTELEMTPAPTYSKGQELTEGDIDTYYEYNVDLIRAVLHNFSWAGLANPEPLVEYSSSPSPDYVEVHRCESEDLTIGVDYRDQSVMLSVCDPRCEDASDEITVILLSRREIHILRTFLNKLKW